MFFLILLRWRILHRYASTNRRRCAQKPLHRAAFMRRYSCTERFVHREAFTHRCLYTQRLLHEVFTQRSLHTDALHKDAFARIKAHRRFYTQNLLHREAFVQNSFYIHKETFTQKNSDPEKLVHTDCTKKLLHTETFTCRNFTQRSFHTQNFFPHRCLYAQKFLRTAVFTYRRFYTDAFTQKNFYTQKLVHTARFYTQPAFTQRGFASPFFWLVSGYMGLYENGVPDNPMVYHHFPRWNSYVICIHMLYIYIFTHTWWRWYPTVSQCLLVWHAHFQS